VDNTLEIKGEPVFSPSKTPDLLRGRDKNWGCKGDETGIGFETNHKLAMANQAGSRLAAAPVRERTKFFYQVS
jgi:hypothetical protein